MPDDCARERSTRTQLVHRWVRHGQFPHPGHQLVPVRVRRRRAALRAPVLARKLADMLLGDVHHHRPVLGSPAVQGYLEHPQRPIQPRRGPCPSPVPRQPASALRPPPRDGAASCSNASSETPLSPLGPRKSRRAGRPISATLSDVAMSRV
jgi:hypothetical protein